MEVVHRATLLVLAAVLVGCSSSAPPSAPAKEPILEPIGAATTTSRHPYAKYLEITGFRLRERAKGKLEVKLAVINHSEADLGDVTLQVRLKTTASAPEDPPVTQFEARVLGLGPQEIQDVTGAGDTALRVYELPDWQFLRAEFDITYPPE
jgi:hypothetical protein